MGKNTLSLGLDLIADTNWIIVGARHYKYSAPCQNVTIAVPLPLEIEILAIA